MTGIIGAIVGDLIGCHYERKGYETRDYNLELLTNYSHFSDD